MDLHPEAAVAQTLAAHAESFGQVRRDLDQCLQEIAVRMEDLYPDLHHIPDSFLAAFLRLLFGVRSSLRGEPLSTLRVVESPHGNDCVHLYDAGGTKFRIRKRPSSLRRPEKTITTSPAPETLWGPDYSALDYELAVLWTPDHRAKALGRADLAAVSQLDTWQKAIIWHDLPLPTTPYQTPPAAEDDEGGFEEDFGEDEGTGSP